MTPPAARAASGFSLVEVLVALGLLAGVLITVAGLLLMGGRQLERGRQRSAALAVARDVLEEMRGWGFTQTLTRFDDDCAPASPCVFEDQAVAGSWRRRLDETLPGSRGEIVLEPLDASGAAVDPDDPDDARLIRVRVRVAWREGEVERDVRLTMVRM